MACPGGLPLWNTPPNGFLQTLISEGWIEEHTVPAARLTCKTWAAEISPFVRGLVYCNYYYCSDQSEQEDPDTPDTTDSWRWFNEFMDHGDSGHLVCPFHSCQLGKAVMDLRVFDEGTFCGYTLPAFSSLSIVSLDCPPGFSDRSLLAIMSHQTISVIRICGGESWGKTSNMITNAGFITAARSAPVGNLVELRVTHFHSITDDISVCFDRFTDLEHLDLTFTDVREECFASCRLMPKLSCLLLVGFPFVCCCDFSHLTQMQRLCHFDMRAGGYGISDMHKENEVLEAVIANLPHLTVRYTVQGHDREGYDDSDVIRHAQTSL